MTEDQFRTAFIALSGNENGHFPWQWALYQEFAKGNFPASCNLPTGLGKTSVIALWLIAPAESPGERWLTSPRTKPRSYATIYWTRRLSKAISDH